MKRLRGQSVHRPRIQVVLKIGFHADSARLPPMNTINNTLNGLASSLLLNIGLTSIAEKLDPMQNLAESANRVLSAAEPCVTVCNFSPEAGQ